MSEQEQRPDIRVGIISPCPPPYGGVTRIVENHLRLWSKDQVEAHLIPNYPPEDPDPFREANYHDLHKNSGSDWQGFAEYIKCLIHAPPTRLWVYKKFVKYNLALSKLIKDRGLNALYAHQIWPAGTSAVLQGRIHGIPSIVTAYGETWHTTPQHKRQKRVEPYTLKGATKVIATSQHCLNGALRRGAEAEKSSVIHAGIDLERFQPSPSSKSFRQRYKIEPGDTVISVLGLALRRKLDTLLDALEGLPQTTNVHCLIGGIGNDLEYVKERVARINSVAIQTLGFVAEKDLPSFYNATDILVVSPRTNLECMGQSMKEAMACGKAVVGARIGGVEEAVIEGENGLLFEPDNPTDLSRALSRLINDVPLRQKMGVKGREIAEKKFSADLAAARMLEIFESVITKP